MSPGSEQHISISKSARLYLLGDARHAQEVWIVCHGYGQLAGKFIRSFEAIAAPNRVIVAPEALHRFYLDPPPAPAAERRVGATWMTREDREFDIRDNVGYLDAVVAHVATAATKQVRVLGFSQGCAAVFRWAVLGSTRIDDLIFWSGEVPPDVDIAQAAQRLANTRITIVHGEQDELAASARPQLELLETAGIRYELHRHGGGHRLDSSLLRVLADRP